MKPTPPGVPIPYPNTGMASDCTDGSKSVTVSGKEALLKNKSYFKSSMGDEAGSAPKKGVVTSMNRGKVYFTSWSMDVKIEGENVVRHMDMTTHNHASVPGNTAPWPFLAGMSQSTIDKCSEEKTKKDDACAGATTKAERCASDKCKEAMKSRATALQEDQGDRLLRRADAAPHRGGSLLSRRWPGALAGSACHSSANTSFGRSVASISSRRKTARPGRNCFFERFARTHLG